MSQLCRKAFRYLYLRVSVTPRCDLRCQYCRPAATVCPAGLAEEASDAELCGLTSQIDAVAPLYKVRITGGEPLVRPGLIDLIGRLRLAVPKAKLALTTNGSRLERLAGPLRRAGISSVNISVDSVSSTAYRRITRGGSLAQVLRGLAAAREAGFTAIRLNAVLLRRQNGEGLSGLVRMAAQWQAEIRFIELMPFGAGAAIYQEEFLSGAETLARLARSFACHGTAEPSSTARRYRFDVGGREVIVGLITPVSHPFCGTCDRIRLDSGGRLRGCMRNDVGVDLLSPWRDADHAELRQRITGEVCNKSGPSGVWPSRELVTIGG